MNQSVSSENSPKQSQRRSIRVIKKRVKHGQAQAAEEDFIAIEDPLEISLVFKRGTDTIQKKYQVTMRTPGHDEALIHGLLYSEGGIQTAEDITQIQFNGCQTQAAPTQATVHLRSGLQCTQAERERHFIANSSCGVCGTQQLSHLNLPKGLRIDDLTQVSMGWIHQLASRLHQQQSTFHQTGGLHAAAIFDSKGQLQNCCEDIGRHNALDKTIGQSLLNKQTPATGQTLCVSGRMSYEIIQKALVARIPIIAGIGAPSSLAVSLANDFNLTLIGFLRADSYNIYSCPERLANTPQIS